MAKPDAVILDDFCVRKICGIHHPTAADYLQSD
jgi:hypothetical protein